MIKVSITAHDGSTKDTIIERLLTTIDETGFTTKTLNVFINCAPHETYLTSLNKINPS